MDDPSRAVVVQLFDEVQIVQLLNAVDPDPSPAQLAAIAQRFAAYGGVASAVVVERFWFGNLRLSPDQLAAIASGDSYEYD
jgi:hypothetical protein